MCLSFVGCSCYIHLDASVYERVQLGIVQVWLDLDYAYV
jgi:hypothetical protein